MRQCPRPINSGNMPRGHALGLVAAMHGSCSAMSASGAALPIGALVAVFQLIEHRSVLRIKEHQRRAVTREGPQQRKRVAA